LYPNRLVAFCGVNPLRDYALQEIDRCAADPRLRRGLKLHFGNSDVRMDNPAHVEQIRRVFALANRHRMAIVVHVRPNINNRRPWGMEQARLFVEGVLPAAKDIVVQIAHVASAGGYEDDGAEQAMGYFAESIARKDPRMKRVYFDVSVMRWESKRESLTRQLRAAGMKRLLYASDSPPLAAYRAFRNLPLSPNELRQIERNIAPYLR
jgi:predicted TIM-barrel fold metal-dependent hydrolase